MSDIFEKIEIIQNGVFLLGMMGMGYAGLKLIQGITGSEDNPLFHLSDEEITETVQYGEGRESWTYQEQSFLHNITEKGIYNSTAQELAEVNNRYEKNIRAPILDSLDRENTAYEQGGVYAYYKQGLAENDSRFIKSPIVSGYVWLHEKIYGVSE